MIFEYDKEKSAANKRKHGLDFIEAQALWRDSALLEIPAKTVGEPRFLVLGRVEKRIWAAIITYRDGNIRIISVRRARKEESEAYENI